MSDEKKDSSLSSSLDSMFESNTNTDKEEKQNSVNELFDNNTKNVNLDIEKQKENYDKLNEIGKQNINQLDDYNEKKLAKSFLGDYGGVQKTGIAGIQLQDPNNKVPSEAYKDQSNNLAPVNNPSFEISKEINTNNTPVYEEENKNVENVTFHTEEEKIIHVVKETKDSIENFEKSEQEEEEKKANEFIEKEKQLIDSITSDINSEMSNEDSDIDSINIQPIEEEKEVVFNTKDVNLDEKKEYIGGTKDTSLFKTSSNKWGRKYINTPMESIPEKTLGKEFIFDGTEESLKDFALQKSRFLNSSRIETVLPFSGMTVTVDSYTGASLSKLFNTYARWRARYEYAIKNNNDDGEVNQMVSESYYNLRSLELDSIYDHIVEIHVVGKEKPEPKPDKDLFFKMVKYPDLDSLYFSVFHSVNRNKRKKYVITCHRSILNNETGLREPCGGNTAVDLYDEELIFTLEHPSITKADFYSMIYAKDFPKNKKMEIAKLAETEIFRMNDTKINFVQHMPSLWDYLDTLRIINGFILNSESNHQFSYDLSEIDREIPIENWNDLEYDRSKVLKSYLYLKRIDFPYLENENSGNVSYRTFSSDKGQREIMFDIINSLDLDDTYLLLQGKEIRDLMTIKILKYYVPGIKCSKCGNNLDPIEFDIRQNFFTRLSEARMTKI